MGFRIVPLHDDNIHRDGWNCRRVPSLKHYIASGTGYSTPLFPPCKPFLIFLLLLSLISVFCHFHYHLLSLPTWRYADLSNCNEPSGNSGCMALRASLCNLLPMLYLQLVIMELRELPKSMQIIRELCCPYLGCSSAWCKLKPWVTLNMRFLSLALIPPAPVHPADSLYLYQALSTGDTMKVR